MTSIITLALLLLLSVNVLAQDSEKINIELKKMVEKMDREGLLSRTESVTIKSKELLKIPETILHLKTQFSVATEVPEIEFVIIPNKERYQIDPPPEYHKTVWSNWGQGVYVEDKKTYYAAFGNNRFDQARIFITEYDLESKKIENSQEINQALGINLPNGFGDGKIHGWLDYSNNELYFSTYWAHYPRPLEKDFQLGYDGGRIASYNIDTKKVSDFGVPMPRVSWPYHRYDIDRGLMFAIGFSREFLCYDLNNQKVRFAGFLPEGMMWNNRFMLLDDKTGMLYSDNRSKYDSDTHFIKYDYVTNLFTKMESKVPANIISGRRDKVRAHTKKRSKDGWFICVTQYNESGPGGQLFKFYPAKDKVEIMELCWPGEMRYTTSMALSSDEKYLYYLPGAHGKSHLEGSPVVQYNVKTGERKVLAFLFPYIYEKFGYVTGGSFSISIDEKGENLFICMNGKFIKYEEIIEDIFGDTSVLIIKIPKSERM
ncbi:MAG: hypothetical protein L3J41_09175 [Melioribacteraceae bacterium]|nr:hypothetical protein [Melioribacteraceae bacterium]